MHLLIFLFFFFNDTATTEIYTLSLHDALPISRAVHAERIQRIVIAEDRLYFRNHPITHQTCNESNSQGDRKSTRLNSSHLVISYAVFCLKKKKKAPNKSKTS